MNRILTFILVVVASAASAQSFTFLFLHKKTDKAVLPEEEVKKIQEGHMDNLNRLAQEGKLIAAGPFEGGGGIYIFKSGSPEEVNQWMSSDPGVQAKRWNLEILPYTPRYGSVCSVGEPYQMVNYHFVQYLPKGAKDNQSAASKSLKAHNSHLKKIIKEGNVVTEAIFGEQNGGVIILKGDLPKELIEKDPALTKGILDVQYKKLYIAKGAFCEK